MSSDPLARHHAWAFHAGEQRPARGSAHGSTYTAGPVASKPITCAAVFHVRILLLLKLRVSAVHSSSILSSRQAPPACPSCSLVQPLNLPTCTFVGFGFRTVASTAIRGGAQVSATKVHCECEASRSSTPCSQLLSRSVVSC